MCIKDAFSESFAQDLKLDAVSLKQNDFGANNAGIAASSSITTSMRRNVHQIWLSSPTDGSFLANVYCGNHPARQSLLSVLQHLTSEIQILAAGATATKDTTHVQKYSRLDPTLATELSYLCYEPGSYYQKHIDRIQHKKDDICNNIKEENRRVVSLIYYLGHGEDLSSVMYDETRDGGCLRIYESQEDPLIIYGHNNNNNNYEDKYEDVRPVANTLVLLDSASVPHEVLETFTRSRMCVVGWLHGPT